jgi:hypothetical protein
MRNWLALAGAISVAAMSAGQARAEFLNFGTTYTVNWNFGDVPGNSTPNTATVTLSSSQQTFGGGNYLITEHTTPIGGGAEYVEFFFSTETGAPLISNGNNGFSVDFPAFQLTGPAIGSNPYFDFAKNGVPNTGITSSGGIGVEANPNPGSVGAGLPAFFFPGNVPSPPANAVFFAQFQFPFNVEAAAFKQDPSSNGYFFGLELRPPAVPESSTWAMMLLGFAGLGWLAHVRRRKLTPA